MEIINMTTHNAPTGQSPPADQERITCAAPINDMRPKLMATLVPTGISVWCKYHKTAHIIPKEKCMAFWSRGESVQCKPGDEEPGVDGTHNHTSTEAGS
jgi:hypothetical protein